MASLHWLIFIPYYFFAALSAFLALMLLSRVLRLGVRANSLAMAAVAIGLIAAALPLLAGWATLAEYTGLRMLILAALTFALAALDAALEPRLGLPLDRELSEL